MQGQTTGTVDADPGDHRIKLFYFVFVDLMRKSTAHTYGLIKGFLKAAFGAGWPSEVVNGLPGSEIDASLSPICCVHCPRMGIRSIRVCSMKLMGVD